MTMTVGIQVHAEIGEGSARSHNTQVHNMFRGSSAYKYVQVWVSDRVTSYHTSRYVRFGSQVCTHAPLWRKGLHYVWFGEYIEMLH